MEAPEFYNQTSGFCAQMFSNHNEKQHLSSLDSKPSSTTAGAAAGGGDHFMVEDLLDFSNEDDAIITDAHNNFDNVTGGNSTDSSTVVDSSCNSSSFSGCEPCFNGGNAGAVDIGSRNNFADASHFSSDLCVPYDDLAELEWLSNFVEESFSSEDLQKLQLISGIKARPDESSETGNFLSDNNISNDNNGINGVANNNNNNNNTIFHPEMPVPAKARSKRSRAAPCNWASRLLVLSSSSSSLSETEEIINVGPTHHPNTGKKTVKVPGPKRRDGGDNGNGNGDGRKCLHCATDKTPQWRTGPMGPKTLCNACGVRYKSGRLVPEYRPAASPTFVLTKHSNSHRKVLELRRQKEMVKAAQQQQHQQFLHHNHHHHHLNMVFDVSNGDDYLIHQHVGPDFRQLI